MKLSWTKGLDKDAKEELKGSYLSSLPVRQRLEVLIQEKLKASYDESKAKSSYENPNWAYLQADHRGYERALHEIIKLIQ
jgi:hypothetical protein